MPPPFFPSLCGALGVFSVLDEKQIPSIHSYFYYSLDGKEWTKIGDTLKMSYELTHFMGYRFGLFNYATEKTGGYVEFDYYRIDDELQ